MLRHPDRRAPGSCGTGCVARFAVEALRRQHETLLRTNKPLAEDSGRCQAVTPMRTPRRMPGPGAGFGNAGTPIDPHSFVSIDGSGNREQDSPHFNVD